MEKIVGLAVLRLIKYLLFFISHQVQVHTSACHNDVSTWDGSVNTFKTLMNNIT